MQLRAARPLAARDSQPQMLFSPLRTVPPRRAGSGGTAPEVGGGSGAVKLLN